MISVAGYVRKVYLLLDALVRGEEGARRKTTGSEPFLERRTTTGYEPERGERQQVTGPSRERWMPAPERAHSASGAAQSQPGQWL